VTDSVAFTPVHLPPLVVWALLAGSGFVILLGTGVIAFWLDRRSRRAARREQVARATAAAAASPPPLTAEEAAQELTTVREAAARAATAAAHARHDSDQAGRAVEDAERHYTETREAHRIAQQRVSIDPPVSPAPALDAERDVARAALGAYRRGDLSAEDLRKVWYTTSGWDATNDAAEQEVLRLGAEEIAARQEYHRTLAAAQAARRAEYLADTAARALAAEAMTAAAELGTAWRPPSPRSPGSRGRRSQ
jgi:hypothetical protein